MSSWLAPPRSPAEAQQRREEYAKATPAAKRAGKKKQEEALKEWEEAWRMYAGPF